MFNQHNALTADYIGYFYDYEIRATYSATIHHQGKRIHQLVIDTSRVPFEWPRPPAPQLCKSTLDAPYDFSNSFRKDTLYERVTLHQSVIPHYLDWLKSQQSVALTMGDSAHRSKEQVETAFSRFIADDEARAYTKKHPRLHQELLTKVDEHFGKGNATFHATLIRYSASSEFQSALQTLIDAQKSKQSRNKSLKLAVQQLEPLSQQSHDPTLQALATYHQSIALYQLGQKQAARQKLKITEAYNRKVQSGFFELFAGHLLSDSAHELSSFISRHP